MPPKVIRNMAIISTEAQARGLDFTGEIDSGKNWVAGLCKRPNETFVWVGFDFETSQYYEKEN